MPLLIRVINDICNDPIKSLRLGIGFSVAAIVLIVVGYIGNRRLYFTRYLGFACIVPALLLLRNYRANRSRPLPQPAAVVIQSIPPPSGTSLPPSTQMPPPYPATDQTQMQPSQFNASTPTSNTGSTEQYPYPPYPTAQSSAPPPYPATESWQSYSELPPPPSYDEAVRGSNANDGTR